MSGSVSSTCVELLGSAMQTQQVVDHGGLAHTPWAQEQHHRLGGDLSIWRGRDERDRETGREGGGEREGQREREGGRRRERGAEREGGREREIEGEKYFTL